MARVRRQQFRRGAAARSRSEPLQASDLPPHMRWLVPRLLLTTVLFALATPVEVAVPVVRSVQGRRGVQSGPAIAGLSSVAAGLALVAAVERKPESVIAGERSFTAVIAAAVVLPASAAFLPATVVLRGRSPLWGWALWLGVRLSAAALLATGADRARKRLGETLPHRGAIDLLSEP
jgi:hypothetical protein